MSLPFSCSPSQRRPPRQRRASSDALLDGVGYLPAQPLGQAGHHRQGVRDRQEAAGRRPRHPRQRGHKVRRPRRRFPQHAELRLDTVSLWLVLSRSNRLGLLKSAPQRLQTPSLQRTRPSASDRPATVVRLLQSHRVVVLPSKWLLIVHFRQGKRMDGYIPAHFTAALGSIPPKSGSAPKGNFSCSRDNGHCLLHNNDKHDGLDEVVRRRH
ncbi:uncharacterized protein LOC123428183 isoform X3 [Hordeum vulgare subsp. vulgare]|uniref:uncharacterized protein LOC123428183 isoform X3 n=1 Tax=Hordeum vulgare subsp. vulgare TaxID=112509 RepID=UPI001D1A32CF|nr:uncharacterized protein LOC123428183 isoform X3 [Hordeum vulgare subsp. vulgare]